MASTCTHFSPECSIKATTYGYYPNLAGNTFFTIYFGLVALGIGTFMEAAGYVGRIIMHYNPWSSPGFRLQIFCLILAPTFIAASIYLTLKHIIIYVGPRYSRLEPRLFTWVFVGCDAASIALQAAGGGVVNSAGDDMNWMQAGNHIIIAGIAFQVATVSVCGILAVDFFIAAWKDRRGREKREIASRRQKRWVWIIFVAEAMAYVTVLIRCIYRIPEMAGGWGGSLMKNEEDFMILDGMMIALAVLAFTLFHPGLFLPTLKT
ncbi:hypothetical protein N7492_008255 [Penicillium capsulatum]|uniref:RTA1 domain protein n=1 Tax=Penicillium capsulatum TaxID=69766 RepID=A0A9W9HRK5_9EURO|nr:hypothetical protein N7492_008255 [Penicillium capsulatum]KAJ6105664.1 hypothetical protein N7512_009181 [Penicillium capsulatum]